MYNPVRRLKDILGELLLNGWQAIDLSRLQTERLASLDAMVSRIEGERGAAIAAQAEAARQLGDVQARMGALHVEMNALHTAIETGDAGQALLAAYRRIGVLNYQNDDVSGERGFLGKLLQRRPEAVVFDVGANAGQFSQLVRSLSEQAVIHAFEPHPNSFALLEAQAERLGIQAQRVALGDASGEVTMYDYADDMGSQHASLYRDVIETVHRRPSAPITAPCRTLDEVADGLGVSAIDLLKIDTEGHEFAVLKGARGLLERQAVDIIQFEFNEMNVISRVFMRDFMQMLPAYRFFRLLPQGALPLDGYDPRVMEIFAFQNIVCVRRDIENDWVAG